MATEPEAAVCREIYRRLVGALGLVCGDLTMAEDLAQEALVRLWERWGTNRRPDDPMAWCYRVGVNLARSAARRHAVEQRILRRAVAPSAAVDTAERVSDVLPIRAAVLALPIRQRQAIVARYYLGLSVAQTATAMQCAPGTVTALTNQAVANLRQSNVFVDEGEEAGRGC